MKYLLLIVGLLGGFALPGHAISVTTPEDGEFAIPAGKNGAGVDTARRWSQPGICQTRLSATCVVCASATKEGILVGIEVSSGAVGSYAVAIDTGAIPSAGLVGPPAASGAGSLLTRQKTCEYTLATVDTNKGSCGNREFSDGRPFSQGLTICGSADVNVVATYRVLKQ